MAQKLNAVIFLGSVREVRNADRVLAYTQKLLGEHFDCKVLDPKVLDLPLLHTPLMLYKDPSTIPKNLAEANEIITAADAYVFIAGEYNRSYQPALKNMIDHFSPTSFGYKPAIIVPYSVSSSAGICAADALLSILRTMGLYTTPAFGYIGMVEKALNEDGEVQPGFEHINANFKLSVEQLYWIGGVLKKGRLEQTPAPKVHPYL